MDPPPPVPVASQSTQEGSETGSENSPTMIDQLSVNTNFPPLPPGPGSASKKSPMRPPLSPAQPVTRKLSNIKTLGVAGSPVIGLSASPTQAGKGGGRKTLNQAPPNSTGRKPPEGQRRSLSEIAMRQPEPRFKHTTPKEKAQGAPLGQRKGFGSTLINMGLGELEDEAEDVKESAEGSDEENPSIPNSPALSQKSWVSRERSISLEESDHEDLQKEVPSLARSLSSTSVDSLVFSPMGSPSNTLEMGQLQLSSHEDEEQPSTTKPPSMKVARHGFGSTLQMMQDDNRALSDETSPLEKKPSTTMSEKSWLSRTRSGCGIFDDEENGGDSEAGSRQDSLEDSVSGLITSDDGMEENARRKGFGSTVNMIDSPGDPLDASGKSLQSQVSLPLSEKSWYSRQRSGANVVEMSDDSNANTPKRQLSHSDSLASSILSEDSPVNSPFNQNIQGEGKPKADKQPLSLWEMADRAKNAHGSSAGSFNSSTPSLRKNPSYVSSESEHILDFDLAGEAFERMDSQSNFIHRHRSSAQMSTSRHSMESSTHSDKEATKPEIERTLREGSNTSIDSLDPNQEWAALEKDIGIERIDGESDIEDGSNNSRRSSIRHSLSDKSIQKNSNSFIPANVDRSNRSILSLESHENSHFDLTKGVEEPSTPDRISSLSPKSADSTKVRRHGFGSQIKLMQERKEGPGMVRGQTNLPPDDNIRLGFDSTVRMCGLDDEDDDHRPGFNSTLDILGLDDSQSSANSELKRQSSGGSAASAKSWLPRNRSNEILVEDERICSKNPPDDPDWERRSRSRAKARPNTVNSSPHSMKAGKATSPRTKRSSRLPRSKLSSDPIALIDDTSTEDEENDEDMGRGVPTIAEDEESPAPEPESLERAQSSMSETAWLSRQRSVGFIEAESSANKDERDSSDRKSSENTTLSVDRTRSPSGGPTETEETSSDWLARDRSRGMYRTTSRDSTDHELWDSETDRTITPLHSSETLVDQPSTQTSNLSSQQPSTQLTGDPEANAKVEAAPDSVVSQRASPVLKISFLSKVPDSATTAEDKNAQSTKQGSKPPRHAKKNAYWEMRETAVQKRRASLSPKPETEESKVSVENVPELHLQNPNFEIDGSDTPNPEAPGEKDLKNDQPEQSSRTENSSSKSNSSADPDEDKSSLVTDVPKQPPPSTDKGNLKSDSSVDQNGETESLKDVDHWKARALNAEAHLKALAQASPPGSKGHKDEEHSNKDQSQQSLPNTPKNSLKDVGASDPKEDGCTSGNKEEEHANEDQSQQTLPNTPKNSLKDVSASDPKEDGSPSKEAAASHPYMYNPAKSLRNTPKSTPNSSTTKMDAAKENKKPTTSGTQGPAASDDGPQNMDSKAASLAKLSVYSMAHDVDISNMSEDLGLDSDRSDQSNGGHKRNYSTYSTPLLSPDNTCFSGDEFDEMLFEKTVDYNHDLDTVDYGCLAFLLKHQLSTEEKILGEVVMQSKEKEDKEEETMLVPVLIGSFAERMMISVFQKYATKRSDGKYVMDMRGWKAFIVDSHIFSTHVPKSSEEEPVPKHYSDLRKMMTSTHVLESIKEAGGQETGGKSFTAAGFKLSFTHFLQLVVKVAAVIYPGLYRTDATQTLNKFLKETIVPFYTTISFPKRFIGSSDILLSDRRILLLLQAYSPNLWAVYTHYVSVQGGIRGEIEPYINAGFPKGAQLLEGAAYKKRNTFNPLMSEAALVRIAEDYGITPTLIPRKVLLEICRQTACKNSPSHQATEQMLPRDQGNMFSGNPFVSAASSPISSIIHSPWVKDDTLSEKTIDEVYSEERHQRIESIQRQIEACYQPERDNEISKTTTPDALFPQRNEEAQNMLSGPKDMPRIYLSNTRVSFCEMIEVLSRGALEGMHKRQYNSLFCMPYDKVAALLSVWRLADPERLEQLKLFHK